MKTREIQTFFLSISHASFFDFLEVFVVFLKKIAVIKLVRMYSIARYH